MGAPKGSQFWKLRSKHGRNKLFATPELLWESACEYFEWCDNHPWVVKKTRKKGKTTENEETPTQMPYSLTGFALYCGASEEFWRAFKKANHPEFKEVIARVESVIETQQFTGATVGAFNANIISRKLGLIDKQENAVSVKGSIDPSEWIKGKVNK